MNTDLLANLARPIVLAPMAGGPSTPELCAAVCNAGGFGFLASGYLSADELSAQITRTRALTSRPFGVNLFVPGKRHDDTDAWLRYREHLSQLVDAPLPQSPTWSDDDYEEKVAVVVNASVPVVSFTFGNPSREIANSLREQGSLIALHATTAEEVAAAAELGDVIVVQGKEAGGHRASPLDEAQGANYSTKELLKMATEHDLPVIAAGGVATAQDVRELTSLGAVAVQVGTRFLTAEEAGTKSTHRAALLNLERETVLTRAFSGRTARAIRNEWTDALTKFSPSLYPEVHYLTAEARKEANAQGNVEHLNLWAGTGYRSCTQASAEEIVQELCAEL
ncbi:NAD(P)H-dependent flavin oxidoreductase [Corynebacterium pelargi]|uniref:Propionate 3-nitronate monooxygenase n=1 Tax=Corynebacterium pelargi TaxID=1471400 RepID=A0A410W7G9_9CORY|nr:nitronate monooxygenase [Corynebacterium pelargi]QAU51866.1 Nitronate monooxygenase [Corynebacterium pelargi]GGG71857.1 2-nitropropane dioxygenase [Corynebacterium pelargi]